MPIPFIDLSGQHKKLRKEILSAVSAIFDTQQFVLKKNVIELENEMAAKSGSRYGIGVASGSDALYLSLAALGIGAGDEVITTPFTFFATAGAISRTGATPVFADIDPKTLNLDPEAVEVKITPRTKVLLPVHFAGLNCQMKPLLTLAKKNSLFIVEDAAQSYGAEYLGQRSGSMGDTGCFSFYPTKNLGGAGDGGMIITSSKVLNEKIRLLRDHGSAVKYYHDVVGINSRLDEIQAAVIRIKIKHIEEWNRRRREHAAFYDKAFKALPLELPQIPKGHVSTRHLYSVLTSERDALASHLTKNRIGWGIYYPLPLHLQPCYKALGYRKGNFPAAERAADSILALPMYAELTDKARRSVADAVRSFFGTKK